MPSNGPTRRELFERHHDRWLAPQAVREAGAGPRRHQETPHPYRTCFQRDRDRIIHCSAFRRLDFKTQVFVPHEHDHFRTRLTHTLEVAQVARTIGRALGLNEDLLEAVALAHDLGHPPFGHTGEKVLDDLMADYGRFEHNRQSLRVVDYLEHPYPDFRGLNLTPAVRECLAKHETRYDTPICEDFQDGLLAPLEGQLVDLADEVAYTGADLEDALAAGLIDLPQLEGFELWRLAWARAELQAPQARAIHKRIRACKALLAEMADDAVATTERNIADLGLDSPDDARRAKKRAVAFSKPMREHVDRMQEMLLREVYLHGRTAAHNDEAKRIISDLFSAYTSEPTLLPKRYRNRVGGDSIQHVTCDYIAGMTDRFCRQQYRLICC